MIKIKGDPCNSGNEVNLCEQYYIIAKENVLWCLSFEEHEILDFVQLN